jgi:hypothetical protein
VSYKRKPVKPEDRRRRHLRHRYGIEPEAVDALVAAQDGKCALCERPFSTLKPKQKHVDHDHKTGAIRGVLCDRCNRGLGYLQEDTQVLAKAIVYLGRIR